MRKQRWEMPPEPTAEESRLFVTGEHTSQLLAVLLLSVRLRCSLSEARRMLAGCPKKQEPRP